MTAKPIKVKRSKKIATNGNIDEKKKKKEKCDGPALNEAESPALN